MTNGLVMLRRRIPFRLLTLPTSLFRVRDTTVSKCVSTGCMFVEEVADSESISHVHLSVTHDARALHSNAKVLARTPRWVRVNEGIRRVSDRLADSRSIEMCSQG